MWALRKAICASAATSTEEIGNPSIREPGVNSPRRESAALGKKARRITQADYQEYDLLIGMDENNIRNMRRFWQGIPDGKSAPVA